MRRITVLLIIFCSIAGTAQVVYEDINNKGIYDFLDELANLKVIEINSVVKPYSRQFIAEKLVEAKEYSNGQAEKRTIGQEKKRYQLNKRQVKELEFYWQDYQIDRRCEIPNKDQNQNSKKQNPKKVQKIRSSEVQK